MHSSLALYLAMKSIHDPPREQPRRCCDDRPVVTRPVRRRRSLFKAIPAAAHVFRHTLRTPVSPSIGTPVVTTAGTKVGSVEDVVIGIASRTTGYAVAADRAGGNVVWLPDRALRRRADRDAFVLDEGQLDVAVRELLLAG